jgi:hypothetical protein
MKAYNEGNHKIYVEVITLFDIDGNFIPLSIVWRDGRRFEIDKILYKRKAASLKAGGVGMRYKIRIKSTELYLFYEKPKWFLEI